jgi:tetratricopeptide (TPR) repeat protein
MEAVKKSVKFNCQESSENMKKTSIHEAKRKRLFDQPESEIISSEKKSKVDSELKLQQMILKAFQGKEYQNCLDLLDQLSESTREQTQFLIIRASCWTHQDINFDKSAEIFNDVIRKEPTNSFAYYGLGLNQYRYGDLKGCQISFSKAVELNRSMRKAMEFKAKAKSLLDLITDGVYNDTFFNLYITF